MLTYDHEGAFRIDNHAWRFPWKDGSVFQAGPSKVMHWYDTNGQGNVTPGGARTGENDAMCGVNVMYDVGKIFSAGGSQFYHLAPGLKTAHLIEIDEVGREATVEQLPDMHHARTFANAVVLSDGKILITGGQGWAEGFTDKESVFIPELFNPATKTFTELAPEAIPRNYHSVFILLADGTISAVEAVFAMMMEAIYLNAAATQSTTLMARFSHLHTSSLTLRDQSLLLQLDR